MARSATIREDIRGLVDSLIEIYEESNPEHGEVSELTKMENISIATDIWWRLFGELMGWAQSHLVGYAVMKDNSEFVDSLSELLGKRIHQGSHELEYFGWTYSPNRPCGESASQDQMDALINNEDELISEPLTNQAMRTLIAEILMSRSGTTSFWRMPFQHSLFALNFGEVDSLSSPSLERKRGRPYQLRTWKILAVSQVYYLIGKGTKKYVALERVGIPLGQSSETLRIWEKDIIKTDPDGYIEIFTAKIAGENYQTFKSGKWTDTLDVYEHGSFRGSSLIRLASYKFESLESQDLNKIREMLRLYREK